MLPYVAEQLGGEEDRLSEFRLDTLRRGRVDGLELADESTDDPAH